MVYFAVIQAGEALGAIGSADVLDILREYAKDPQTEVHTITELLDYSERSLNLSAL